MAENIGKWETAAGEEIIGDETQTVDGVDLESPDDKNEALFGHIEDEGVIAYTVVWGIFSGPPDQRKIVEWDQKYDTDYKWNADDTCDSDEMDFENIATHELGHSIGLDHPGQPFCSEQTMWAYADYGETKKRSLECGDITGAGKLYE